MNVITAIETRRSVRHFDPSHAMTEAEVERLISLAMLSPTPGTPQPWRFVVVRDAPLRRQIRAACQDQAQVTDASLLVIVVADLSAGETGPTRHGRAAEPEMSESPAHSPMQLYAGREWLRRDDAMKSTGLAAMTLMLAAPDLGCQSCPMYGVDVDAVGKLIGLPDDLVISMLVAIGKAIGDPEPPSEQLPIETGLVRDRFAAKAELARSRAIVLEQTAALQERLRAQQTAPKP